MTRQKPALQINNLFVISLILLLFSYSLPLEAAERILAPSDFKNLRQLNTKEEGVLYRVPLEPLIYKGLAQSQYKDLAVFNAKGELVPFEILQALPLEPEKTSETEVAVPFFELPPEAEKSATGGLDVYVQTGNSGQIVEVKSSPQEGGKPPTSRQYLLDLSSLSKEISNIQSLRLSLPEEGKYAVEAILLESDSLSNWGTLIPSIPLVRLENKDSSLTVNNIELPRSPKRYLLLRIEKMPPEFDVKTITAVIARSSGRLIHYESAMFDGMLAENKTNILYDTLGAFPIEKIDFPLKEAGLYHVQVETRASTRAEWQQFKDIELTMMQAENKIRRNSAVSIPETENRYWRLKFQAPFSAAIPQMRIFWRARDLFFLAQGGAPYLLAFGNPDPGLKIVTPKLPDDSQLKRNALIAQIGEAPTGSPKEIKNPAGGNPEWQRYLLWGLLVTGGFMLSFMAWKLLKKAP